VAGVNVSSTGIAIRNIMYRNTGTQVRLTPRVTPEKAIALDLRVDDARLHVPEDGIPIGKDEKGMPILATEFIDARLEAKLSVPSGKAVAALGVKTNSKSGNAQTLIVVTARVVEPDK
jgi:type II secretory pathway component HofQ